jgi:hypothetical protein
LLDSAAYEEGRLDSRQVIFQRLHRTFRTQVGIVRSVFQAQATLRVWPPS